MIGGLSWSTLQAFLVLAREERLTSAARKLGIDHTTLRKRIDAIESTLGATLFERKPSGYFLTSGGESVVAILEEMESVSMRLSTRFAGLARAVQGTVRVAAPDVFANRFLAPKLPSLTRRYADLDLELVSTPRSTSLTKREADVAITTLRPLSGRLHSRKLLTYELGLYSSPAYLDRAGSPTVAELQDRQLVGYIDELILEPEMNSLKGIDPGLRPRISCTNVLYQMSVIKAGGGIGVLPCWLAADEAGLVRVLDAEVVFERGYWLNLTTDMRTNPAIRAVCDFIVSEVEGARATFHPTSQGGRAG